MHANEALVIEDGVWKSEVGEVIEQGWINSVGWGWARNGTDLPRSEPHKAMSPVPSSGPRYYYNNDINRPPAIPRELMKDYRFAGRVRFPEVKPMWFHYRNPISGRTTPCYCPHILSCFGP